MNGTSGAKLDAPSAMPRRRWRWIGVLAMVSVVSVLVASYHNVPVSVSAEDREYIARIFSEGGHDGLLERGSEPGSFDHEVHFILAVQDAVLRFAPHAEPIPNDQPREPKDLYQARRGQCFDRSRTIEKALALAGFRVRHVAVYATDGSANRLAAMLIPSTRSHSLTEVETSRGWMAIDSNGRWIGLTSEYQPVSVASLQRNARLRDGAWAEIVPERIDRIFTSDFVHVIGLFSRHGGFYAPYTPVPDVNWGQLLDNLPG